MDVCLVLHFKSEFNSLGEVLALWAMKNNVSSATNCLPVETIWFGRLLI